MTGSMLMVAAIATAVGAVYSHWRGRSAAIDAGQEQDQEMQKRDPGPQEQGAGAAVPAPVAGGWAEGPREISIPKTIRFWEEKTIVVRPVRARRRPVGGVGSRWLAILALGMPCEARDEWLEEHRRYLLETVGRWRRLRLLVSELRGLPAMICVIRSGRRQERA